MMSLIIWSHVLLGGWPPSRGRLPSGEIPPSPGLLAFSHNWPSVICDLLLLAIWHIFASSRRTLTADTATGCMHPTGMHSCFFLPLSV